MENSSETTVASDLHRCIVYEDADIVVLNKPTGIAVHGDGRNTAPTVVDWFLSYVPSAAGVGEPAPETDDGAAIDRSGVVHRLDRDTSGVLVLVKHQAAHQHFKQQFHDRLAHKTYRAFVYGAMKEWLGTIDRPIGRSAKDWRLRSAERGAKGTLRDAVTRWELIGSGEYRGEVYSYIELMPETGRTHQLRVHMKAIDHPIVHDPLYAGKRLEQSHNLDFTRLALHAYVLDVEDLQGEQQHFVAPVPPAFDIAADYIASK